MTSPHPGSRIDASQRAAAQERSAVADVAAQDTAHIEAVPVVTEAVRPAPHAVYATRVLPAGGTGQLLPRDELRQVARIIPVDAAIIVATSKDVVQANTPGATIPLPAGGWLPEGELLTVTHSEPVWAIETTGSAACRVAVFIETAASQ